MRILVLTNRFPRPGHETDATYNGYQVDALAVRNQVRAIVPIPWPERLRDRGGRGAGTRSARGDVTVDHPTYWFPPRILEPHYGAFFLRSVRPSVMRAAAELRPEVIFACWAHPDGWAAVQLGRELNLPVITKVIGSDVLVLPRDRRRRARVAEALRGADAVLAVSEDLARHVQALGVDPHRVHVVPEGTHVRHFGPGDRAQARGRLGLSDTGIPAVLFVGNLLMSKGAGVLLEACALLAQRGVAFRCHLVGRGRDEPRLRALVARLGLGPEAVDFTGPCSQDRLADWYRACDLVALPSFSEGVPNVLREAMACGRRFVATRVGGVPEIARPGVGMLVEPGDAAGLAESLAAALAGGAASTASAEPRALAVSAEVNVSWERSAEMVEDHCASVVREHVR